LRPALRSQTALQRAICGAAQPRVRSRPVARRRALPHCVRCVWGRAAPEPGWGSAAHGTLTATRARRPLRALEGKARGGGGRDRRRREEAGRGRAYSSTCAAGPGPCASLRRRAAQRAPARVHKQTNKQASRRSRAEASKATSTPNSMSDLGMHGCSTHPLTPPHPTPPPAGHRRRLRAAATATATATAASACLFVCLFVGASAA
jgi:hypothetical protein